MGPLLPLKNNMQPSRFSWDDEGYEKKNIMRLIKVWGHGIVGERSIGTTIILSQM